MPSPGIMGRTTMLCGGSPRQWADKRISTSTTTVTFGRSSRSGRLERFRLRPGRRFRRAEERSGERPVASPEPPFVVRFKNLLGRMLGDHRSNTAPTRLDFFPCHAQDQSPSAVRDAVASGEGIPHNAAVHLLVPSSCLRGENVCALVTYRPAHAAHAGCITFGHRLRARNRMRVFALNVFAPWSVEDIALAGYDNLLLRDYVRGIAVPVAEIGIRSRRGSQQQRSG
jgi:hypothetical protein